jgi:hypothetical protein
MREELRYAAEKNYLVKEQYAGMVNYQHRKNIFQHGDNIPLMEWLVLQYTGKEPRT